MTLNKSFQIIPSSLVPSPVYDTYWRFAAERQNIFFNRIHVCDQPFTQDPILQKYKFTNAYRASDRVSQFLIKSVIYSHNTYFPEDMLFRIILFKLFNKIETWLYLEHHLGDISYTHYNFDQYDSLLTNLMKNKHKIYSAAYIMPSGISSFGYTKKHQNNLQLLEYMMQDGLSKKIAKSRSLNEIYKVLLSYPTLGKFLAFQYSIDINYSELCDFDEMSFVVAGPGAKQGITKCFDSIGNNTYEQVIHIMAERQQKEFQRLDLDFKDLWGRPLQLIDCQNLFCETDKYLRAAASHLNTQNKMRIKQTYKPSKLGKINYFYPPKWRLLC